MNEQQADFYQKIRIEIKNYLNSEKGKDYKWSEYLLAAPDLFHLLVKLTLDEEVMIKDKAILGIAIAYFLSPIDIIPEAFFGPVGLLDDIAVAAYALNLIVNNYPELARKHWAGEQDLLVLIQNILTKADDMIGSKLINKIKKLFGGK